MSRLRQGFGGQARGGAKPYLGPYPIREGVTCADFDAEGRMMSRPSSTQSEALQRVQANGTFTAEVGRATVDIFHNGYFWVMRFAQGERHNRLMLGEDLAQITALRDAFVRALQGFHSQFPMIMVGGVAFNVEEARAMLDLLALVLIERSVNG